MFDILLKLSLVIAFTVGGYFVIISSLASLGDGSMTSEEFFSFIGGVILLIIAFFLARSFFRNKGKAAEKPKA